MHIIKAYLCLGNQVLERVIEDSNIEVEDCEENLYRLYDMMDFIDTDAIIINRALDDESGSIIIKIAERAKSKNIRIVILTEDLESYSEKKVVTNLVKENVTAFIKSEDFTSSKIEETLREYPKEFDFNLFSETKETYEEFNNTSKKVIVVYSPLSEGTSTIAAHLSHCIAENNNKVCLLDFNILRPKAKNIFNMTFEYNLEKLLEDVSRRKLTPTLLESYGKESKYVKGLDVFSGMEDLNETYTINKKDFKEIIENARFNYDYVVIDTNSLQELIPTEIALTMADEVIIPMRGRDYSIETNSKYFNKFEQYKEFDTERIKIVVNKFGGDDLTFIEIQAKLKHKVIGYISDHKDYDIKNAFKNKKLISEYDSILKELEIPTEKRLGFSLKNIFSR